MGEPVAALRLAASEAMITEGFLVRHAGVERGRRDLALLDVAQDYALRYLYEGGVFDLGVVLKGGTSLRKFRAGDDGRFSTDLDFTVADAAVGEIVFDLLDGADFHDVHLSVVDRKGLHGRLRADTPLGRPQIPGKLEMSVRPLWMPPERREPISLAVHRAYEFELPPMPVPVLEEALAEKLAAWRRRRKMRDLYDLYWFAGRPFDEALVRRLTVLKVWHDVVDDGLGNRPFDPAELIVEVDLASIPTEEIGLLTRPFDPARWFATVGDRYGFVADLDDTENAIARCSPGDRYLVSQAVGALGD
jgi:predicted nucleotidyltransferase component of viral defense system